MLLLSAAGCDEHPSRIASGVPVIENASPAHPVEHHPSVIRPRPESLPHLKVEVIEPQSFASVISAPARVDFRAKAVSSAGTVVAGRVSKVYVQIGDRVKAGAPLATIASVEAAQMRADFDRAKAELAHAEDRYRRQVEMQRTGVGLEVERIEAQTLLSEARADFERSRDYLNLLGDGKAETVTVRASSDSTVLRTHIAVGTAVAAGAALFDLGEPTALWVVADVFEKDLLVVEIGADVNIHVGSLQQPVPGRVVAESVAIQTGMRRAEVFIEPAKPEPTLRPGMYARAYIEAAGPRRIVLPTSAVLIKGGRQNVVYVETQPGLFEERPVLVGPAREGMTPVLEGLAGGERVVVSGALLLDTEAALLL
jgi:cobalt-zinc-cadmium efflux system membrane fusion protein